MNIIEMLNNTIEIQKQIIAHYESLAKKNKEPEEGSLEWALSLPVNTVLENDSATGSHVCVRRKSDSLNTSYLVWENCVHVHVYQHYLRGWRVVEPKMKPCPWCAEHKRTQAFAAAEEHFVKCLTCKACGPSVNSKIEAINRWNAINK